MVVSIPLAIYKRVQTVEEKKINKNVSLVFSLCVCVCVSFFDLATFRISQLKRKILSFSLAYKVLHFIMVSVYI